jgi:hypothetical protein
MKPIYFCHFENFKPLKIKGVIEFRVIYGFKKSFYTKNFKVDTILTKIILGLVSRDLNKRFNILGQMDLIINAFISWITNFTIKNKVMQLVIDFY